MMERAPRCCEGWIARQALAIRRARGTPPWCSIPMPSTCMIYKGQGGRGENEEGGLTPSGVFVTEEAQAPSDG